MLTKVPFQFEIDMKDVFSTNKLEHKSCIYRLYAFIVHLVNIYIIKGKKL